MNARDDLIAILHREATADRVKNSPLRDVPVVAAKVESAADAILAAGFRRPRVVTTVAELDAMPTDSVVLNSLHEAATRHGNRWYFPAIRHGFMTWAISLPATVLHEPEADQ